MPFAKLISMINDGRITSDDHVRAENTVFWEQVRACGDIKVYLKNKQAHLTNDQKSSKTKLLKSKSSKSKSSKSESSKSSKSFIGIDFGTTKTMVAEYDSERKMAKVQRLGRGGFEMPTSIYVTEHEEVLFGDDADDEGLLDSSNHIRRFKMLLGKSTRTQFGTKTATPIDLTSEFLTHVRTRLESEVLHQEVEGLVLTVPAMFGPAQRKDLTTAAERAGFKRVELLAEPVAAGIAYCDHHADLSKNLRFLVVDWGGGTFDLALVERNGAYDCKVIGEFVTGTDDIGGEDLDDELWVVASGLVQAAGFQSLELQPKHEWGKYRRDLTRAKESLSIKTQVTINFTLDSGRLARIPMDRPKLEEVFSEKIQKGARQVAELVARCRKSENQPDFILLAGGTSRIPMIAQILETATGLQCRAWSEGRDAIALGAAIHAHRIFEEPTCVSEPTATTNHNNGKKLSAMSQYKSLLEGVWIGGKITNEERIFLGKKRKKLGLTLNESQAIQIQVLGAPLSDMFPTSIARTSHFQISLERSLIGLQVIALAPEAHADIQRDELIRRTHFPMAYLVNIENSSSAEIHSVRVSLTSSDGQQHSILIPSIKPGKSGALSLASIDFDGWMVEVGDTLTVDATGLEASVFAVTAEECAAIDNQKAVKDEIPCVVFVRKAAFSSNFVLKIVNIQKQKIEITGFESPAGSITSPIEIEPDSEAEIGWCELSNSRNLAANETFRITFNGFRDVQGYIAEGQLKNNGLLWKGLAVAGGIAVALAGG